MKHFSKRLFVVLVVGIVVTFLSSPLNVYAGLVPCGNTVNDECTLCDLQNLAVGFVDLVITLSTMIATLLFVQAGILYVFSPANPTNIGKAHKIFLTTLVGFVIILASWLIISLLMSTLYKGSGTFGTWNNVLCVGGADIPRPTPPTPGSVTVVDPTLASGQVKATGPGYAPGDLVTDPNYPVGSVLSDSALAKGIDNLTNNCTVSGGGSCADYITQQAIAKGVDPKYALALAVIESGGCSNPATCQSGVGAVGVTQLMPDTAREVCGSACVGKSNTEMQALLRDPANNISWGVAYMAKSSEYVGAQMEAHPERFNPERKNDYMAAYYNGGATALEASNDCGSSMTKYECGIKPGGYVETQGYVEKMNTYVNSVDKGTVIASDL